VLALATACVSPSRTDRDYELKAGNSAKAVASSVSTALLGAWGQLVLLLVLLVVVVVRRRPR
jgi:hypothetical protein